MEKIIVLIGALFLLSACTQEAVMYDTMKNISASGKSLKCTWSRPELTGVAWVVGNHTRTETRFANKIHVTIDDGRNKHIWTMWQRQGTNISSAYYPLLEKMMGVKVNNTYYCKEKQVSASRFSLPAYVKFKHIKPEIVMI